MARKEAAWGYFFIAPIMIGFLVFMLYPFAYSFYLSLTSSDGIVAPDFIGLNNYRNLLQDETFLRSLRVTVYFTLGTVPVGALLSLLAALLLNRKMRFTTLYRTAFFLPVITSTVAIATVWKWLYNTDYGLINSILGNLGWYQPPWLASERWALFSVIIMSVWKNIGFNMVIFLAGLQGISPSLYEAAKIDGAGAFKRFVYITVPMLRHTTVFVVIMAVIGSFQVFDQVFVMTDGGPAKSTTVVVYYIYQNAFKYFNQGYASAMAYVLFAIIFAVTLVQTRLARSKDVNG
ncbi:carbohydrate ABC transporter permease [Paenibacillaceae bacterium WGS1546]|uniref:carbohydrate ABC transporter permease n=1 Tax=Cohnella sp. WGS1546 TaxID=3366810 RepID=UPI00372D4FFC